MRGIDVRCIHVVIDVQTRSDRKQTHDSLAYLFTCFYIFPLLTT